MPTLTGASIKMAVVDELTVDQTRNLCREISLSDGDWSRQLPAWKDRYSLPGFRHTYTYEYDQKAIPDEIFRKIDREMTEEAIKFAEFAKQQELLRKNEALARATERARLKAEAEEKERIEMEALKSLPGYGMF